MTLKEMSHVRLSLPMVISIVSLTSSVIFMSGKYFAQIESNTNDAIEMKQTLTRITEENKKLWEYVLKNSSDRIKAEIISDVIDQ